MKKVAFVVLAGGWLFQLGCVSQIGSFVAGAQFLLDGIKVVTDGLGT